MATTGGRLRSLGPRPNSSLPPLEPSSPIVQRGSVRSAQYAAIELRSSSGDASAVPLHLARDSESTPGIEGAPSSSRSCVRFVSCEVGMPGTRPCLARSSANQNSSRGGASERGSRAGPDDLPSVRQLRCLGRGRSRMDPVSDISRPTARVCTPGDSPGVLGAAVWWEWRTNRPPDSFVPRYR
jgi:hypothetical protein